jgi:8-oxo-dGTP pyrophosphatase MutT (NUDIX family)
MGNAVLVVVPLEGQDRYLVVEERDGTWYLPAGRVEPSESLLAAAVRETEEEAGVRVELRGLLALEHDPQRFRFVFVGRASADAQPKRRPDEHTRSAAWKTVEELRRLPLRHPEVLTWIARYEQATALLPCSAYVPLGLSSP